MDSPSLIKPKQQRSQQTQDKLIAALQFYLRDKFFEHISIKELTENANVSVGTFYRRFKSKESLLPLLYQDFGRDLEAWLFAIEQEDIRDLKSIVNKLCSRTYTFFNERKGVFRTLHLNSRLHSDLLTSDKNNDRRKIYQRMAHLLASQMSSATTCSPTQNASNANTQAQAEMAVFIMINALLDKVVYKNLTPAIATELEGKAFVQELERVLLCYLGST